MQRTLIAAIMALTALANATEPVVQILVGHTTQTQEKCRT